MGAASILEHSCLVQELNILIWTQQATAETLEKNTVRSTLVGSRQITQHDLVNTVEQLAAKEMYATFKSWLRPKE